MASILFFAFCSSLAVTPSATSFALVQTSWALENFTDLGAEFSADLATVDASAFSRLVDHPFEGEDAELDAIVSRLVASLVPTGRDVVRAADIDRILSSTSLPSNTGSTGT